MSRTWKLLSGGRYVEPTNVRKQIKKAVKPKKKSHEKEAIKLFKYWNSKGKPFTKGRINSKISRQGLKLCEKALEKLTSKQIKQSINGYYNFLSHPHTTLGPNNPISPPVFRDFFKINRYHYEKYRNLFEKSFPNGFKQWVIFAMDPMNIIQFMTNRYYNTYSLDDDEQRFFTIMENRLKEVSNVYITLNTHEIESLSRGAKLLNKYAAEFDNYFLNRRKYADWVTTLFTAIDESGMEATPEFLGSEFPYRNLLRRYLHEHGYRQER